MAAAHPRKRAENGKEGNAQIAPQNPTRRPGRTSRRRRRVLRRACVEREEARRPRLVAREVRLGAREVRLGAREVGRDPRVLREVRRGAGEEEEARLDGDGGAVRIRRRNSRRHLHLDERQRHGGQDPHLRRNHPVGEGPGPPAPVRERHARLRQPDGLRRAKPVLRVHHGPLREPDRTRSVHARRRPPTSCRSTTRRTRCTEGRSASTSTSGRPR